KTVKEASLMQWQRTMERLQNTAPSGRLVIHISKDIKRWANTSADVEVRCGRCHVRTQAAERCAGRWRGLQPDCRNFQTWQGCGLVFEAGRRPYEHGQSEGHLRHSRRWLGGRRARRPF